MGVSPSSLQKPPGSRPPSRNESPLGRAIGMSVQEAGGTTGVKSREDMDLERALAESAAMSRLQSPQESGILDPPGYKPYFGPANRAEYDPHEWAMVTTN